MSLLLSARACLRNCCLHVLLVLPALIRLSLDRRPVLDRADVALFEWSAQQENVGE